MNVSSLVSELYQHLHERGDLTVFPIGSGSSAIHSVYVEDGSLIISDSIFGSFSDLINSREEYDTTDREGGGEQQPIFGGIGDMFRAPEVYADDGAVAPAFDAEAMSGDGASGGEPPAGKGM